MNEQFIKNCFKLAIAFLLFYSGILSILLRFLCKKGIYVLNYHNFNTFVNDYWRFGSLFCSKYGHSFERQILFYEKHFHKIQSFNLKENSLKKPAYLLTFDDGYKDNFDIALPVLRKYSVPTVFLITTAYIGTDNLVWHDRVRLFYEKKKRKNAFQAMRLKKLCKKKLNALKRATPEEQAKWLKDMETGGEKNCGLMMNWEQIKQAFQAGVMIGSHSHAHSALARLSYDQQFEEIARSSELIKRHLLFTPRFFSYPQGDNDSYEEKTVKALKQAGIEYAFTIENGINDEYSSPYYLKRIGICPSDPVPIIALKVVLAALGECSLRNFIKKGAILLKQYGSYNFARRTAKNIIKRFGIHLETYYLLHRYLDENIERLGIKEGVEIADLSYQDLEESQFFDLFPPMKKEIIRKRFFSPDYQPFGAKIHGRLVYITWIANNDLRIEAIRFHQKLAKGESVLVDSFAHPDARGLGLHTLMNGYRLNKLRQKAVKKVYAAVLAENRPALRTQLRYGFKNGEKITWLKWGRWERYFTREISFS